MILSVDSGILSSYFCSITIYIIYTLLLVNIVFVNANRKDARFMFYSRRLSEIYTDNPWFTFRTISLNTSIYISVVLLSGDCKLSFSANSVCRFRLFCTYIFAKIHLIFKNKLNQLSPTSKIEPTPNPPANIQSTKNPQSTTLNARRALTHHFHISTKKPTLANSRHETGDDQHNAPDKIYTKSAAEPLVFLPRWIQEAVCTP